MGDWFLPCKCGCGGAVAPNRRFIHGHNRRKTPSYTVDAKSGCWVWDHHVNDGGYGQLRERGTSRTVKAHRYFYELHKGPIPEGLTLDHLCRNRRCVNPDHLEPVTQGENTLRGESPSAKEARQTHCIHGHPFDEGNTYIWRGWRKCRACHREVSRRYEERQRVAA